MRRDPILKIRLFGKPCLFGIAKFINSDPIICSVNNDTKGDKEDILLLKFLLSVDSGVEMINNKNLDKALMDEIYECYVAWLVENSYEHPK